MRWGYGLKAILADEVAAEMTGVHTVAHKLAMFVASAVFIGLTGAMIAWNWSYVDPYMAFDLAVSFDMLVMAMFGGFGTVAGPVLGAVVMSVVKEVLSTSLPHFHPIIFGVLVIVLIIWCPGGIIQAFDAARAKLRTWARPRTERARTMSRTDAPVLEVEGLSVSFGGVQALQEVTFQVEPARSSASWVRTAPARRRCST